jgi:hypothetical protein
MSKTRKPAHAGAVAHAKLCGSYHRGHTIHWIQARKAAEDQTGREPGRIVETGAGWLVVRMDDGSHRRYGNHDIPRLEHLLEEHGTKVTVQERWRLLWLGSHLISISGAGR